MKRREFLKAGILAAPAFHFAALNAQANEGSEPPFSIDVSANDPGAALDHFWSRCVGAGRANEGLRANWQEQLKLCFDQCGFRYTRFHGLFHDDMFIYREVNGKPLYNWQYVDDLFDRLLEIGIRPFVEMTFFPRDISPHDDRVFWWGGHVTPPEHFDKWTEILRQFANHCIGRYGIDEVRNWYFEIWNEPNLEGFWRGTQAQFFEMYKRVALTLKAVDQKLRIGGPATSSYHPDEEVYRRLEQKKDISAADFVGVVSKGPWIEAFLAYCEKENLPVDFVSSHPYPTSYPIDSAGNHLEVSRPVFSTHDDIVWLRNAIAKTRYANAQIHLTEWSSSPSSHDYTHDYLQAATFIVKVNLDCIGLAQSLSYWTFTDIFEEQGAGDSIFYGGFGLVNFQGIVKPSFHAYRMLNLLGDQILHRENGCVVTKKSDGGQIAALLYNYPEQVLASVPLSKENRDIAEKTLATGASRGVSLHIGNLKPGTNFRVQTLDSRHGFAMRDWQAMGSPEPPTREQAALLRKRAMELREGRCASDSSGSLRWEGLLEPWSVVAVVEEEA